MYYYETVPVDNGRLTECPECHNTEFSDGADYCRICGASRKNLCLYEGRYQHENPANARFCETCGAETTFFRYKLLTPWIEVTDDQKGEAPLTTAEVQSSGFTAVETDELPF